MIVLNKVIAMQSADDSFWRLDQSEAKNVPNSPSPPTVMDVPVSKPIITAHYGLTENDSVMHGSTPIITTHYGLTENDLINHNLPPKLNQDHYVTEPNPDDYPYKRLKSSRSKSSRVPQFMKPIDAFNHYLSNHDKIESTTLGCKIKATNRHLDVNISSTKKAIVFTIHEEQLPYLEQDIALLDILADIFQFNEAYSKLTGQRTPPSSLIIQKQTAPTQFTPLSYWNSEYDGYEFNLKNLNEHLTVNHLPRIRAHEHYPSNAWITIGDDVDSALYIRINKAPMNQSTIAVTESTKASIFGDSFDEHEFLPTFRLIALDTDGIEQCVGSGQLLPNQTFLFHTIDAFQIYRAKHIIHVMESIARVIGARKIILYDAAKIMTKKHQLFYSIAYSMHDNKHPFYSRFNYQLFNGSIAILDGGKVHEFDSPQELDDNDLYATLKHPTSWQTLLNIVDSKSALFFTRTQKKAHSNESIYDTWLCLVNNQQQLSKDRLNQPKAHNDAFKWLATFLNTLFESTRNKKGQTSDQTELLNCLQQISQPRAYQKHLIASPKRSLSL
ncbi:MAG: hypothetical protein ACON35_02415 [Candidatus Marinamargulisbacteria bacterium]